MEGETSELHGPRKLTAKPSPTVGLTSKSNQAVRYTRTVDQSHSDPSSALPKSPHNVFEEGEKLKAV